MNPEIVRSRVLDIARIKGDDESAHSAEDTLFQDVLAAIADGKCERPEICAAEALKSLDTEFARWCV